MSCREENDSYRCTRCGTSSIYNHTIASPLQLAGQIPARLCDACAGEWGAHLQATEAWRRYVWLDTRMEILRGTGELGCLDALVSDRLVNDLDLARVAKAWLAEGEPR